MANFWSKLGLTRNRAVEQSLHEGFEPATEAQAAAQIEAIYASDKRSSKSPPTTEARDLPIVDILTWNANTVRSAVASHVGGMFGNAGLLTDAMLADDRIQGATNGRTKGVTKSEVLLIESDKTKDAAKAKEVKTEIEALWPEMFPESLMEDVLKWQIFTGFCLLELIWEARDGLYIPRLKPWHPLYIYYNISTRKYIVFTMDGQIEIEPNDPRWALYTPYGAYRGWLRGAVRSVSIPWLVRQFALRDWARYSEVHGLPQKKAKVPAQAPAEDKRRFFNSVKRLGSESAFLLPVPMGGQGAEWDVELLEATDKSWAGFDALIERCDKSITLCIRGTNLTTEVKGGSLAATKAHRDEDSDYAEADARKLSEFVYKQILMAYCLYNHGNANLAPTPAFEPPLEEDKKLDADTLNIVASSLASFTAAGWKLDAKKLAEQFDIPLLEVTEPVVPEVGPDGEKTGKTTDEKKDAPEIDKQDDDTELPE